MNPDGNKAFKATPTSFLVLTVAFFVALGIGSVGINVASQFAAGTLAAETNSASTKPAPKAEEAGGCKFDDVDSAREINVWCTNMQSKAAREAKGKDYWDPTPHDAPKTDPETNKVKPVELCVTLKYKGKKTKEDPNPEKKPENYECKGANTTTAMKDKKAQSTVVGVSNSVAGCCTLVEKGPDGTYRPVKTPDPRTKDPTGKTPDGKTPDGKNPDGGDPSGKDPGGKGGGGMPQIPMPPPPMPPSPPPPYSGNPQPQLPPPSCSIYASPTSIQQGGFATLTWNSSYAHSASISNIGTVAPGGSRSVNPTVTTTYTLTVSGPPSSDGSLWESGVNLISSFIGQGGGSGRTATCSATVTVAGTVTPPPPTPPGPRTCTPPAQPPAADCRDSTWQPQHDNAGCLIGWKCAPPGSETKTPSGTLACRPSKVDPGANVTLDFRCEDSSESVGNGFSTGGAIFGTSTAVAQIPSIGANDRLSYVLTCKNASGGAHASSCSVELNRTRIVLVANPQRVSRSSTSNIGWVTGGMQSCIISSPELSGFTSQNAGRTNVNGTATTPELTSPATFVLKCTTQTGGTKSATTTVTVN